MRYLPQRQVGVVLALCVLSLNYTKSNTSSNCLKKLLNDASGAACSIRFKLRRDERYVPTTIVLSNCGCADIVAQILLRPGRTGAGCEANVGEGEG